MSWHVDNGKVQIVDINDLSKYRERTDDELQNRNDTIPMELDSDFNRFGVSSDLDFIPGPEPSVPMVEDDTPGLDPKNSTVEDEAANFREVVEGKPTVGTRVEVQFKLKDGTFSWFPGTVIDIKILSKSRNKYEVQFDDGDKYWVPQDKNFRQLQTNLLVTIKH